MQEESLHASKTVACEVLASLAGRLTLLTALASGGHRDSWALLEAGFDLWEEVDGKVGWVCAVTAQARRSIATGVAGGHTGRALRCFSVQICAFWACVIAGKCRGVSVGLG